MKKPLQQIIKIPDGVEVSLDEDVVIVKGSEGEVKKKFDLRDLDFKKEDEKIVIAHKKATKKEKKMMNTIAAHIQNMVKGVQEKFEYKLKACYSHFPITLKAEDSKVIIKNFLGEKINRTANIPKNVDVKISGQEILLSSVDKEAVGQAAANLERMTKIKGRDRRVFQDGIFMTSKAGREI